MMAKIEEEEISDARAQPDMPQSPSPYPPLPDDDDDEDDAEDNIALSVFIASLPKPPEPLDWDQSFDNLGPAHMTPGMPGDHTLDSASSIYTTIVGSASTVSTTRPTPPPKDADIDKKELPRSQSKASKRSNEPSSPVRPLKRLKEALASRKQSHRRSPSKVPLPKSPTQKHLSRQPSDLDDILAGLRYTQVHLSRSVDALKTIRIDLDSEKQAAQHGRNAVIELLEERRMTAVEIGETERQNTELRNENRRLRADMGRAASESRGMIARLESRLEKEQGLSAALREEVDDLTQKHGYMDRRVFELQQDLAGAQEEVARLRAEKEQVSSRLDEAEFAHRALKEGGARLNRELADKSRRIEELEKGKGRRWAMI